MIEIKHSKSYHFTTQSHKLIKAVGTICHDHKCQELLTLFSQIKSRKKRNIILRMTRYLGTS